MRQILSTLFIITALATLFEFYFICGMFTGPIMMAAIFLVGSVNTVYSAYYRRLNEAVLYFLCMISLCVGYLKMLP